MIYKTINEKTSYLRWNGSS